MLCNIYMVGVLDNSIGSYFYNSVRLTTVGIARYHFLFIIFFIVRT